MIFCTPSTLDALASSHGTLADQTPSSPHPAALRALRRRMRELLPYMSDDDRQILDGLSRGLTHKDIADILCMPRQTLTDRIPTVIARARWWATRPAGAPSGSDLVEHLITCSGTTLRRAEVLSGWLSLLSMRTLAAVEGVTHVAVLRRVAHAIAAVKDRAPECDTCAAILAASEHRRGYQRPAPSRGHEQAQGTSTAD